IDVQDETALGQQELARERHALDERLEVRFEALPAIVERRRSGPLVGATVLALDERVLAPREERRIEVDERGFDAGCRECPQRLHVVAVDEPRAGVRAAAREELADRPRSRLR